MKYNKRIIIIVLLLIMTIGGATFAWVTYQGRKSALVLNIGDLNDSRVVIDPYQIKETIAPGTTYTSGVYSQVSVLNSNAGKMLMTLFYEINQLDQNLIQSGLKYTIVSSSSKNGSYTLVKTGDFTELGKNDRLEIFSVKVDGNTNIYYRVYLWLDTNVGDQSELQNLLLNVELNANISRDANAPLLDDGMIPVTIDEDGTVVTISADNENWYNYTEQKWANVVLVDNDSRDTYKDTTGEIVDDSDILAYYVWIPRYKYKVVEKNCYDIATGERLEENYPECYQKPYYKMDAANMEEAVNYMQFFIVEYGSGEQVSYSVAVELVNSLLSEGFLANDEYQINTSLQNFVQYYQYDTQNSMTYNSVFNKLTGTNSIDVVFETNDIREVRGNAVTTYKTHPAFVWKGLTLPGIWVGKFETTGDASTPTILPNSSPLTNQNVSEQFITSLKFSGGILTDGMVSFDGSDIYGLTERTNAHMMKNSEWGAVAYLSHSLYGINGEVRINNNSNLMTGCGGLYDDEEQFGRCGISFGDASDYPQSTTGNITGIFDMSGGIREYVMGVLGNSDGEPIVGFDPYDNSGFNGVVWYEEFYDSGIDLPTNEYYNLYSEYINSEYSPDASFCPLNECGGHALNETLGWYSDDNYYLGDENTWFVRGGAYSSLEHSGLFSFDTNTGCGYDEFGWRSVLMFFEWAGDVYPPTCTLSVDESSITANYSDDSELLSYYGWNSSYSGANSTSSAINGVGTYTYYVKDMAGNTGTCSATITATSLNSYPLYCTGNCSGLGQGSCNSKSGCYWNGQGKYCTGTYQYQCNTYNEYVCGSGYTKINDSYCYILG